MTGFCGSSHDDDDEDDCLCRVCGGSFVLDDGDEDDAFCHDCAHDIAEHATEEQVAAARERWAWLARGRRGE